MKKIFIPPTCLYFCIILNIILFFIFPDIFYLIVFPYNLLGIIIIIAGFVLVSNTWFLFKQHNTAHDFQFDKCTTIIKNGIFRFSRNPMYLGMTVILLGTSICFGNLLCLLSPIIFFLIINFVFVPFEEKNFKKIFGQQYIDYKNQVRRWI